MCRYVTEPWDGSHDRLHWHQANGSTVTPSLLRMMTTAQLRLIATLRRVWRLIDWKDVSAIVWHGLKVTVALAIVAGMYTAEGITTTYQWLQPRIANLLQHPVQTVTKGPAILYAESLESVLFYDDSTMLQRLIVTAASEWQTMVENISDKIDEIKYNVEEFVRTIWDNVAELYIRVSV